MNLIFKKMKVNKELLFNRISVPSLISQNLKIEGNLKSNGVIEIEGEIKGDIKADIITIRETAIVEGTIEANIANIKGAFNGKIFANTLNFSKEAKVLGDINYFSFSVEDGASIEGQLKRSRDKVIKTSKKETKSEKSEE
jgi:cytoskeletal protein CcmA (bactofilin family)